MKRILLASCLFLAGCNVEIGGQPDGYMLPEAQARVSRFHCAGHQYITFHWTTAAGKGVVHDPDCPCRKAANGPR